METPPPVLGDHHSSRKCHILFIVPLASLGCCPNTLGGHVGATIHAFRRVFRNAGLKPLLNLLQHLLILFATHKADAQTFRAESTRTADSVEIRVGICRHVVVDGQVDPFDIDPSTEDVSGDTDAFVEFLELLVSFDANNSISGSRDCGDSEGCLPLFLTDTRVHGNAGEVTFSQQFIEFGGTQSALDEDDDLVEFKAIQEVIQFPILLTLAQLDIVLLQPMQGQFGFVVDIDLEGVAHEFLANRSDFLRQGGAEHHDLLLGGGRPEDFLHIPSHIWALLTSAFSPFQRPLTNLIEHFVTLVEDKSFNVSKREDFVPNKGVKPARCADDNVWIRVFVLE